MPGIRPSNHRGPSPLGASWDGAGTHFAVFARDASGVELCLFSEDGTRESARLRLCPGPDGVFCGYAPGIGPGQRYGFRAHGAYDPERGLRFNPNKLLIDPCALAVDRPARWHPLLAGYRGGADGPAPDERDSAPVAPRSVVVDTAFDWQGDALPGTAWRDTVLYECHVKGLTARHPAVPGPLRGRYLGLACPPMLSHLRALGVTAVELLPVAHAYHERFLIERNLSNYWGYNSIAFCAPDCRFSSGALGEQVREFKTMVRALHRTGIEVILDVVYNHTGEADALGPTLSLRGLSNAAYYQLDPHDPRRYVDFTGCGNTLDLRSPQAQQLVLHSLRYWVEHMHVDGFRFDLAPALARSGDGCDVRGGLFAAIAADPLLNRVKLIVEPWDCAGATRGEFGVLFHEWNDRYRDAVRGFFRGDAGRVPELATRLAGSSDLYARSGRGPQAGINFVTSHDGFTLRDLTSYAQPHNANNGWQGSDGARENLSRNFGHEGPSADPELCAVRDRVARSMIAVLACSLGTPMLLAGDEIGRSQRGNNNPYGQDNDIGWVDWELGPRERSLLEHTQRCFALRHTIDAFRRTEFFRGEPVPGKAPRDVTWLGADGRELRGEDWHASERRAFGMWVCGHGRDAEPEALQPSCLVALNGGDAPVVFTMPVLPGERWFVLLDTAEPARACRFLDDHRAELRPHALLLLRSKREKDGLP